MLYPLSHRHIILLSAELERLSSQDRQWFYPHSFDAGHLARVLSSSGDYYYVYKTAGDVWAGYGLLRTFDRYLVPTLGCVIWARYRGKGQGQRLVRELLDEAKRLRFQAVKLKVRYDNYVARTVYEKAGFTYLLRGYGGG